MKLSIVTTMYNSASYLLEFYTRITKAASQITPDYEIIFVDDGSPDHSLDVAHQLHLLDAKVKIVQLSRNFGHHKAMATGLKHADGEYVFLIDSDLEEDPALLQNFWDEIHKENKTDVVYGVQEERKGHWFERWSGALYYKVLNSLSDEVKSTKNISTIRLMKRDYVKSLIEYQEHGYYFGPISILVGFNQQSYIFKKNCKERSSYSFFRKYHMFLDSIISFSSKPLYFIFYFGSAVTLFSFIFMIYLIIKKLYWGVAMEGWTTLVVLTSLFGGLIMFFMGLMSVYILHIFKETKNRPFSVVRKIIARDAASLQEMNVKSICEQSRGEV